MKTKRLTKKQIRAKATKLGCEMRYSGKRGKGFIVRIVHSKNNKL